MGGGIWFSLVFCLLHFVFHVLSKELAQGIGLYAFKMDVFTVPPILVELGLIIFRELPLITN